MQTFFITLAVAFVVIVSIGLFINYSRRRASRGRSGASSTCQSSGGSSCCTCQGALESTRKCAAKKDREEEERHGEDIGRQ